MFEKNKKIERKIRKTLSWKHTRKDRKQYMVYAPEVNLGKYETPFMMEDLDPEIMDPAA